MTRRRGAFEGRNPAGRGALQAAEAGGANYANRLIFKGGVIVARRCLRPGAGKA